MPRKQGAGQMRDAGTRWIEEHRDLLTQVSDTIWNYAEPGYHEFKSAALLKDVLQKAGFIIQPGATDLPTSFKAVWGKGKPVIGLLGEYDALPGQSQKVSWRKEPVTEGGCGHACGHNLLATATLGGVMALKAEMEQQNLPGTLIFYGCPAEELLIGKVLMARENMFTPCDVMLACHPNCFTYVWDRITTAVRSVKFTFKGKAAHAALDPWDGRSALHAVECLNHGVNCMREHILPTSRIHYVITEGGFVPNVVPETAQVWYQVRAATSEEADELYKRLANIAKGAAIMTDTTYTTKVVSCCNELLRNPVMEDLILDCLKTVGGPAWTEKEYAFADEIRKSVDPKMYQKKLRDFGIPEQEIAHGLHNSVYKGYIDRGASLGVSSDLGDASWQAPLGTFGFASYVVGVPNHSWFIAACAGSSIGHKAVEHGAKIFLETGMRLLTDPQLVQKVRDSFETQLNGRTYHCPLDTI